MSVNLDMAELRERVRDALPLAEVMRHDGIEMKRAGPTRHSCECPFHQEKTGSFVAGGRVLDRGHCFGCGWDGDIFAYWQQRRGLDFGEALRELAGLAGIVVVGNVFERPKEGAQKPKRTGDRAGSRALQDDSVMPSLPPLRVLRAEECEVIAKLRGLDGDAVKHVAYQEKRIGFCEWPQYEHRREWRQPCVKHWWSCGLDQLECAPVPKWGSWITTDSTRHTATFRRLDGGKYPLNTGREIKSWSVAGKNWPIGAAQIGQKINVMVVEGETDMLAAFHFLLRFRMINKVAVVAMLGASNSIREQARELFRGKRVRIMQDADLPKDSAEKHKRKMPGAEAAARWTNELTEAGATVGNFCVGPIYDLAGVKAWHEGEIKAAEIPVMVPGLALPDGALVKDVGDLVRCEESVWGSESVRRAFCDWEF